MLIYALRTIELERLEKERLQKEHDAAVKLAADRHKEHQDALADIKKTLVRTLIIRSSPL